MPLSWERLSGLRCETVFEAAHRSLEAVEGGARGAAGGLERPLVRDPAKAIETRVLVAAVAAVERVAGLLDIAHLRAVQGAGLLDGGGEAQIGVLLQVRADAAQVVIRQETHATVKENKGTRHKST